MVVVLYPVKRLLFVSNLFPRPDAPRNGMFNMAFAGAMHALLSGGGGGVDVLVPVAEWRFWRWRKIRSWTPPAESAIGVQALLRVQYVPCFYLPVVGRSLSFLSYSIALLSARDFARDCDAVIGSWLYPDAVAACHLAARLAKPCWIRLHGSDRFHLDAPVRGRICRRALAKAAGVIVNAASMKTELMRRGIPGTRLTVVPNGIDRTVFNPGDRSRRDEGLILWIGNMVPVKRPDLALLVFAELVKMSDARRAGSGRRLRLVMGGSGPMHKALVRLAKRLGIEKQVTFTGSLSRQDVASWMRSARVFLLVSRSEGMPNVVIEALACGTPVVSTAVGDVPALVMAHKNGFVVDGRDADGLVKRLAVQLRLAMEADWDRHAIQESVCAHDWTCAAGAVRQIIEATISD